MAETMHVIVTTTAKLNKVPLTNGNVIFLKDTKKLLLDWDGTRNMYHDITVLETDADRTKLSSPIHDGFYYVKRTNRFWCYANNTWNEVIGDVSEADVAEAVVQGVAEAKRYTDSSYTDLLTKTNTKIATAKAEAIADSKTYTDKAKASAIELANAYTKARETVLRNEITSGDAGTLADAKSYTDEKVANKVDKVAGKSLISDSEIERLASVDNYDDTEIKESIATKQDKLIAGEHISIVGNVISAEGGDFDSLQEQIDDINIELGNRSNEYAYSQFSGMYYDGRQVSAATKYNSIIVFVAKNTTVEIIPATGGSYTSAEVFNEEPYVGMTDTPGSFSNVFHATEDSWVMFTTNDMRLVLLITVRNSGINGRIENLEEAKALINYELNSIELKNQHQDEEIASKQEKLVPGKNITIIDNVISATGGGTVEVDKTLTKADMAADAQVVGERLATKIECEPAQDFEEAEAPEYQIQLDKIEAQLEKLGILMGKKLPTATESNYGRFFILQGYTDRLFFNMKKDGDYAWFEFSQGEGADTKAILGMAILGKMILGQA